MTDQFRIAEILCEHCPITNYCMYHNLKYTCCEAAEKAAKEIDKQIIEDYKKQIWEEK